MLQSPGLLRSVWSGQLPGSCSSASLGWSLEKLYPEPGTAWATKQEAGPGKTCVSRSIEGPPSNLVKNSFIHVYFGRLEMLEGCFVYVWALFSYMPLFFKALRTAV